MSAQKGGFPIPFKCLSTASDYAVADEKFSVDLESTSIMLNNTDNVRSATSARQAGAMENTNR